MQEDENPYEEEKHLPYENWTEESQPEAQEQPASESVADESQPRQGPQSPPAAPTPLPLTSQQKRRQYFLGLGLGLIPLVIFLVSFGLSLTQSQIANILVIVILASIGLYVIELIAIIICLVIARVRFVGYGLLTAFLASPVIAYIGCSVIVRS